MIFARPRLYVLLALVSCVAGLLAALDSVYWILEVESSPALQNSKWNSTSHVFRQNKSVLSSEIARSTQIGKNFSYIRACITTDLHRLCYNRGSDTCRWVVPNSCGFSGEPVKQSLFDGRTILFRGDSTLRDIFSEFTGLCCGRQIAFDAESYERALALGITDGVGVGVPDGSLAAEPRAEVGKADANWEARNLIVRMSSATNGSSRRKFQRALFHFDYHFLHLLEPPVPRNNSIMRLWNASGAENLASDLDLFNQFIVGKNIAVDVAVMSVGIYEARFFAQNNFTEAQVLKAISRMTTGSSIVDLIVKGVCHVLRASAGIFYAPTLECRALRKSKGASRKGASWCSRASFLLRQMNAFIAAGLANRSAVAKECPVYFIPAFLCYGNHWVCTNDGMHGRKTSHYVRSKTHLLRQALRVIFNASQQST
jgi:hypothetical protein